LNGIFFHGGLALGLLKRCKCSVCVYDTVCNAFLIAYVNVNTLWQPGTIIITSFIVGSWGLNHNLRSVWVHIVLVQWLSLVPIFFLETYI